MEDHFISLFRMGGQRNWGSLLDYIHPSVTEAMNRELVVPMSEGEIMDVALKMGGRGSQSSEAGYFPKDFLSVILAASLGGCQQYD